MIVQKAAAESHPPPQPRPHPPLKIYRYFLRGLEQQMWFFGQDVRHGGNLLRRHGFRRFRSSAQGSSRYRCDWCAGVIELHSFCAGWYRAGTPGFLYIRGRSNAYRYEGSEPPDPECFCQAPIEIPDHTDLRDPFYSALSVFMDWLEQYEAWIERLAGARYRRNLHPHCPVPWLPPQEARRWFRDFAAGPLAARVPGGSVK